MTSLANSIFLLKDKMSTEEERRKKALEDYRKKLIEHRELDAKLKKSE